MQCKATRPMQLVFRAAIQHHDFVQARGRHPTKAHQAHDDQELHKKSSRRSVYSRLSVRQQMGQKALMPSVSEPEPSPTGSANIMRRLRPNCDPSSEKGSGRSRDRSFHPHKKRCKKAIARQPEQCRHGEPPPRSRSSFNMDHCERIGTKFKGLSPASYRTQASNA